MQRLSDPAGSYQVVQVYVFVENYRVVIPGLAGPKPDPARTADESSDNDQRDPHQEAGAEHCNRKSALPKRVIAIAKRV